ncbi:hypothetical protein [Candidatus Uabimicrobium sp. HlEnr_7]|uniref:hypothetical protein n=1 Tax=Candidatus Uabimicrobium helgolandensis TaxID=3095367 RepID=UPI003557A69E
MKRKKIFLVLSVWLGIFALAEISVRIYCYAKGRLMPVVNSLENEWEWVEKHLDPDAEFSSSLVFDSSIGWQNKPKYKSEDGKIQLNSRGMRSTKEYAKKKSTLKRILILGDSYTFGSHVANNEIYSHYLDEKLPDYEVLNMAIQGSGNDQHLLAYQKYGKEYQADVVVFGFFVLSYFRNFLSFRGYAKPHFTIENNSLVLQNSHIIPPEELISQYRSGQKTFGKWYDSYLYNGLYRAIYKASTRRLNEKAYGWKVLSLIMEAYYKEVTESGARPLWLIIPNRDVYKENYRYEAIQDLCEQKCIKMNMPYIRLDKKFLTVDKKIVFRPKNVGGHFTPEGHEMVADAIRDWVKK